MRAIMLALGRLKMIEPFDKNIVPGINNAANVLLNKNILEQMLEIAFANHPFKMLWYPVPVVISILIWLFVFYSTGKVAFLGIMLAIAGVAVYYMLPKQK